MLCRGLVISLLLVFSLSLLLLGCGKPQPSIMKVLPKAEMAFTLHHTLASPDQVSAQQARLYQLLAADKVFNGVTYQIFGREDTFSITTDATDLGTGNKQLAAMTAAMTQVFGKEGFTTPAASTVFHPVDVELLQQVGAVLQRRWQASGIKCTVATTGSDTIALIPSQAVTKTQLNMLTTQAQLEFYLIPKTIMVEYINGAMIGFQTGSRLPEEAVLQHAYRIMDGSALEENVKAITDKQGGAAVTFRVKKAFQPRLSKLTSSHQREKMVVMLDGKLLMIATLTSPIKDHYMIAGFFSQKEEAENLALMLNAGTLPAEVTVVDTP